MASPSFTLHPTRALARLRLAGARVHATLTDDDALELRGEDSGAMRIGAAEVARLRLGYSEGRWRSYQAKVWPRHGGEALVLVAPSSEWTAYAQGMRAFAAAVITRGGIVEGGSSRFDALLAPVLFGLLAAGAVAVSLFALVDEPWWGRLLVPALPLALFALFLRTGLRRHWPRATTDVADLAGLLPPDPQAKLPLREKLWYLEGGRRRPPD
jgi:hypothetical protein